MNQVSARRLGFADDTGVARPGLQDCVEAALNFSDSLIDNVVDSLETTILRAQGLGPKLARGPKPVVNVAVEHLVAQRVQFRSTFAAQLRVTMYGGVKAETQNQPLLRFDDLQLLAEDKLDENIEVASAQQEITMAVEDVLPSLDALVSTLLGWSTVQPQLNPLRPEVFVRALRAAMVEQLPNTDLRGALMTPVAGRLGVGIRKLYRELVGWLSSQGIEPAVLPGTAGGHRDAAARGTPSTGSAGSSVARTLLTLERLRKLLSGDLDGPPGDAPDFLYTVPASLDALQDMKMVEAMVQRLAKRNQQPGAQKSPKIPKTVKAPAPQAGDGKLLGKQLGEEVIRLMLESLIEDDRMLVKVRQILETLEPALIRLAQIEPRFFSEKQHPARQLLDRITHRSLGFTAESDEGFDKFVRTVEQSASALLGMRNVSANSFAQVLKILEDAWAREDKAQKAAREESARALLHAEQRNLLAQRLSQEFAGRMAATTNESIPTFVSDFLCGPWAQAVAESQLSYSDNSGADPNALVDELIWSVQPRVARLNRTRLVELVPNLLARLREGLLVISYPTEMTGRFFDQLIGLHETALEGARAERIAAAQDTALLSDAPGDPTTDHGAGVAVQDTNEPGVVQDPSTLPSYFSDEDEAFDLVAPQPASGPELVVGTWVELMFEGQMLRAQLTWVSPHRTLFMFNSAGRKAHSMSRRTLNRLRIQGLMRIVSDRHLVDTALDAVTLVALRNSLEQPDRRAS